MKDSKKIKKIFREKGLTPIAIYTMDSGDGMAIIKIKGKKEILKEFFDPENIWNEEENRVGYQIYKDNKEWYVKLKNNDTRLPGIKDMMVDQLVRENLQEKQKKRRNTKGIKKKMECRNMGMDLGFYGIINIPYYRKM